MIALIGSVGTTLRELAHTGVFGVLYTPRTQRTQNYIVEGLPWALDNDAYSGFDEPRYRRALEQHAGVPGCLWTTTPDVVGDARQTLDLFSTWQPMLREYSYPVALVAQDGLTPAQVPWEELDALFIGGTTEFKMGVGARTLITAARDRGKWTHAGRVNTPGRIRYFRELGVDSFDGSGLARWPRVHLPWVANILLNEQLTMKGAHT